MSALSISTLNLNNWNMLPPLGNLDAYIKAVNAMPMLTLEEEQRYARELREHGSLEAAKRLVLSHLRLVVSTARQYKGYGLPHADLIQEGNVGLMKAVRRFDPEQGVRLVSYALHWVKAEIQEYIIKNWRIVKMATTKAQRKLFFNLRTIKNNLRAMEKGTPSSTLNCKQVREVATHLRVKPEEVREMEMRMSGIDVSFDPTPADDEGEDKTFGPGDCLYNKADEPTEQLEAAERARVASHGLAQALNVLDERSRRIVTQRWLNVNEDGSGGAMLKDLAAEYGISAERVRQIEAAALKKMRAAMAV